MDGLGANFLPEYNQATSLGLLALSPVHLSQKPGGPFLNSLTCSAGDLKNLYLFVYPSNCLGKGLGIKL